MTCVAYGSLVEMIDGDGHVFLKEVETVQPGEMVADPDDGVCGIPVASVMKDNVQGLWVLAEYMGLRAMGMQRIRLPNGEWSTVDAFSESATAQCHGVAALVLTRPGVARIGGVVCDVHIPAPVVRVM